MKSQREPINISDLEKNETGALELLYEYGGGNKKYHLYARERKTGALVYIGTLENTADRIPNIQNRGRRAAEVILSASYEVLNGLEKLNQYTLIRSCWAGKEEGTIPKKL
ncbi:hypothetical protein J4477_02350 [Candidatus Pacearchaeota archaeon]|nr:hypothetical protein [Candidatus Pacearchaeota archaeon]